ncbi:pumilio-like 24 [Quillaja saponaria]|uniref:Pumilio-like 24 n=1 Tax=Quillaja saponaria TaxID=32244 RepID=A0AAD7LBP4_QUISA|nr:pumilio-like 24 [Quillaja saponaria]
MASSNQKVNKTTKRKRIPGSKTETDGSRSKMSKLVISKPSNHPEKGSKKPIKSFKKHQPAGFDEEKKVPSTNRDRRIHAKELTEARKKKRKRHYNLEQELVSLWERMRRHNIAKDNRSKLVTEALEKMKGKIPEIAGSHVSSRVLQTCVKYCSQEERNTVLEELRPQFLNLASNKYAVHFVKKMLDNASKGQLAGFISSLHGHVASLLRNKVGSVVIEHVYQLGNATQKQGLLLELYSTELQLFKGLVSMKESRLVDVISKLGLQKASVLRYMATVIHPIIEKEIVDHSIIHRVLTEYFSLADQSSVTDIIQHLAGPLLPRMIGTKDGARIGIMCVKHGNAKERKKIIKGMKGEIDKIAHNQYGCMVLVSIVSVVDDTKLITKIVIRETERKIKELALDKSGRRLVLQLLHPNCSRYFSPDDLASLNLSIPSLCIKSDTTTSSKSMKVEESSEKEHEKETKVMVAEASENTNLENNINPVEGGKKDPFVRRQELLVESGLAERLIDVCIESAGELLRSNFGREVIYEVATGGSDGILHPTLDDKLNALHEAIASLAALSKAEDSQEEHILENFHSSRTIRKLVLDCPNFASTLWGKALQGNSESWARGHSCKVISAFIESSDSKVRELAKYELQPLVDTGILKTQGQGKQQADE